MTDWSAFYVTHQKVLEDNYPGLSRERFLREALEIDGSEEDFLNGVPFSYLLGYSEFYGFDFKVTPDVLIPRVETEYLVELVSSEIKKNKQWKRLLDVGCGSGCIGLSLGLLHSQLEIALSDISQKALKVAETNAFHHKISAKLFQSNLLDSVTGLFDVVVSNPPYIPRSSTDVHKKTHEFEPSLALYVEDSEYKFFFEKLFSQVARSLTHDGMFFMEGHERHLDELIAVANKSKLQNVRLLKDLSGATRFLFASAPRTPIG
jgi:release factor glutamine methyltransferase